MSHSLKFYHEWRNQSWDYHRPRLEPQKTMLRPRRPGISNSAIERIKGQSKCIQSRTLTDHFHHVYGCHIVQYLHQWQWLYYRDYLISRSKEVLTGAFRTLEADQRCCRVCLTCMFNLQDFAGFTGEMNDPLRFVS